MTAPPYRDPSDVPLGSILGGRYRLEDVVGEGATSRVYRAEDAESGVDVAIKVFAFAGRAANKSFRRFVRELQINAELRHSAFPDLLDSGYVDESGAPYLVMELLEGETLAELLERGPMTPRELLPIVEPVVDALEQAHGRGFVHRDVKPANVFLVAGPDRRFVKLLDFGVSLHTEDPRLTAEGAVVGTPHYLAPELILFESEPDRRVDVYALGVLIYRAITGRLPYTGSNLRDLVRAIDDGDLAPTTDHCDASNPAIDRVLEHALAREPDRRYESARALLVAFRSAVETRTSHPPEAPPPAAQLAE